MSDSATAATPVDRIVVRLRAHSETSKFVYCPMCGSLMQVICGGGGETLVEPNRSCKGTVASLSRDAMIDRLMCDDFDA